MKCIRRMVKLLFLAWLFLSAIILYRFKNIGQKRSFMSSTTKLRDDDRIDIQQLQDSFYTRSYPVYYLWCTNKSFEFRNYLSVTSVVKHLEPDKVVLFYKDYPIVDPNIDNIWLDEILQKYPYLETIRVPYTVCNTNDSSIHSFVSTYLDGFE